MAAELGIGLIGIGRPWGQVNPVVPEERQARALLERAFTLGIRFYDTAPSYGVSEERVGDFLRTLTVEQRRSIRVATKFGEHWDPDRHEPFVDHSRAALRRSLDQSLERLGAVEVLQLHKTTPEVLETADLERAWEYAASLGIEQIGLSVKDPESARIAIAEPKYRVMQLPFNQQSLQFLPTIREATSAGMLVLANRPFGMGQLLYAEEPVTKSEAFGSILRQGFQGVILSGTKSPAHLEENWTAFQQALGGSTAAP